MVRVPGRPSHVDSQRRSRHVLAVARVARVARVVPVALVSLAVAGAASGCAREQPAEERMPAPVLSWPAASAGGACRLLDYAVIEEQIGARFDLAAASKNGRTQSCVVQAEGSELPDLTFSVTKTSADAAIFKETVVPKGAGTVKGLGVAAYQVPIKATDEAGAGVEIGWLTKDNRLMSLRFTAAVDGEPAPAEGLVPKMVALAKKVEAHKA